MTSKEARRIFDRFYPGRKIVSCTEFPDYYVFCAPLDREDPDKNDCSFSVDKRDGIVLNFYSSSMTPKELKKGKQIPIPK